MPSLKPETLEQLIRAANRAAEQVLQLDPADKDKGAMLRLFFLEKPEDGLKSVCELWSGRICGTNNIGRRRIYSFLTVEKCQRTIKNYRRRGHVSSFESANSRDDEYPGAVLLRVRIPEINDGAECIIVVSVSGFCAINDQRTALRTIELLP